MATRLPTGEPLLGRYVRLDLLTETDLPELFPVLADPEIYASGGATSCTGARRPWPMP